MAASQIQADKLLEVLNTNKDIIIYGAGVLGQGLYCLIKQFGMEKNVVGFAVSDHTDHLNEYMGVEIRNISKYNDDIRCVLIAVKEQYVQEVVKNLKQTDSYYWVGVKTLKEVFLSRGGVYAQTINDRMLSAELSDEQYVTFCIRQMRRVRLDFEVNIVDHCNLNCQCCNHFSPLAKPTFVDILQLEKDLMRIRDLTDGFVGRIWLIGGEPLLHPELTKILYFARNLFPQTHITLDTNGLLLMKQSQEFWQALRDTKIELTLTKYPVNIDYERINQMMEKEKVIYAYTLSSAVLKTTYHLPLDLEGKLDGHSNYAKCSHANECVTLKDGRIYTCPIAAHAHYFNEFFDKKLYQGEKNSISIYDAQDVNEIITFLKHPIPFCNHCNIDGYTYGLPWNTSQKDIKEWT